MEPESQYLVLPGGAGKRPWRSSARTALGTFRTLIPGERYRKLIFPWIWTILFLASYIGLVEAYIRKNIFTSAQKNAFNFISTALIVLLGLSFYVSQPESKAFFQEGGND